VRNCSNRVSGSASGGSDTNIPGRGRFVPKYTGRFSGWRGLRYGECHELQIPLSDYIRTLAFYHIS
jgi:hypothetical protein